MNKTVAGILDDDLNDKILKNIRKQMAAKGFTQDDIKKGIMNMNYNASSIFAYLPKEDIKASKHMSIPWILAISKLLNVSLDSFFIGTDYEFKPEKAE